MEDLSIVTLDLPDLALDLEQFTTLPDPGMEGMEVPGMDLDGSGAVEAILGGTGPGGEDLGALAMDAVAELKEVLDGAHLDSLPESTAQMDPFLGPETISRMDWPGGDSLYAGSDGNTSYFMDTSTGYSVIPGEGVSH